MSDTKAARNLDEQVAMAKSKSEARRLKVMLRRNGRVMDMVPSSDPMRASKEYSKITYVTPTTALPPEPSNAEWVYIDEPEMNHWVDHARYLMMMRSECDPNATTGWILPRPPRTGGK